MAEHLRSRDARAPLRRAGCALALAAAVLAGCVSTSFQRAEDYAAQDEWLKAVVEYRKAVGERPDDAEYRSRLRRAELKAADYYYQKGQLQLEKGNLEDAIGQFQQGLAAMPDHGKLQQAMSSAIARNEAGNLYQEGLALRQAGKNDDARRAFQRALEAYPDHKDATAALAELKKEDQEKLTEGLALTSKAPITLNFRQTDLKQAFEFLAKSFGVNVIFDESVKSVPVTLFAKDVTFEQGLSLLLTTSRSFYKKIGGNTILVAPDSKEKRGQYEDHLVRTFHMNTVRAKEMADILKGLVAIKKIIVNEQLNTITVRDTEEIIKLSERIIENNDRKPAEMILDVEILEVNRSKSERLGLDFGTYSITASVPSPGTVPIAGSIRESIRSTATLTVPPVTFRFFKQDVDAKILANPKIRVLNGRAAKIHIGDRVPLRAATIVDATGQTRTTFDYKDIGIRLTVEPMIYLDNSAMLKLGLEVSSLGENLGTPNEPAFRIGTRNAETFMLLRDGETAILGGLIQDEERNTRIKVPGFGDIPAIGALFTSHETSVARTDVLLTITPRVVRGWDVPTRAAREFYSGSENVYSDKSLFASLEGAAAAQIRTEAPAGPAAAAAPVVAVAPVVAPAAAAPAAAPAAPAAPVLAAAQPSGALPAVPASTPLLFGFSEPVYEVASGQDFEIKLVGSNLTGAATVPLEILYNPQLLSYVSGNRGDVAADSFNSSADAGRGLLNIALGLPGTAAPSPNAVIARVVMRGERPGISYLVYRAPVVKSASGETLNAQVRAARVVIR
jgi:general secretion pathway protein D